MKVRRIATLTIAALLSAVVSATAQTINITDLGYDAVLGASGLSERQSVVSNQYGYFVVYVVDHDGNTRHTKWRLVRSVDGGATFNNVLHESCASVGVSVAQESNGQTPSCPGGPAPAIETDRDGNIYVIYTDPKTAHAYLMSFLAANNYLNPTTRQLDFGDAQKFSTVIDESRGVIYYASTYPNYSPPMTSGNTVFFFTIPLHGSGFTRVRLTVPATNIDAHYPYLYLDEHNHLYAAWTSIADIPGNLNYHSIHFMRSRNGGANWETLTGAPLTLPVVADDTGPTHMVNSQDERGKQPWLWKILVKQGKAHFWYRVNNPDPDPEVLNEFKPMQYVRYDTVTGEREQDGISTFGGQTYSLSAMHGDCSTRRDRLDGTIYCVSTTVGPNDSLAVVRTTDNGQTWQDYAITSPFTGCNDGECHFWINTARQFDGAIIGSYTRQGPGPAPVKFFSVPVPLLTLTRFDADVTASSAASGYAANNVDDNNPSTQWVASLTSSPANNNAWIQLDLGSVKEVRQVRWNGATGSPYPAHSPRHYKLEASSDGIHWTIVNTRTYGYAITVGFEYVYLPARYLRLTTTQVNDGTGWSLGFSEFWAEGVEPPSAPRLSTNWVAVSSQQALHPGAYATDGEPNTTWVASPATPPNDAWIQIDLGSIRPITRLKWLGAPWSPAGAQSPSNYRIEVSPDLVTYRTIVNRTSGNVGVIEGDELLAVTARYITLIVTKVNDGTGWLTGLREFWAEGPTP